MEIRQAQEKDLAFVREMLEKSRGTDRFARGFPRGGMEDLERDYQAKGTTLLENFYIVGDGEGIFGIYGGSYGTYLVGPMLQEPCHEVRAMVKVVEAAEKIAGKVLTVDVVETNTALMEALPLAGFENYCQDVAMTLDLDGFEVEPASEEMVNVEQTDDFILKEINRIWKRDLVDWRNSTVEELMEYLQDGWQITARLVDGKVAGAMIWNDGSLEYLCVAKEFEGKGYGRGLLEFAAGKLRQKNIKSWYIAADQSNTRAISLYKSFGFNVDYYHTFFKKELKG
ncbi:MAG: GNAT family N-acetyltransferase [Turicibacter sp.]|nr:GNAT family N-acetyltransferase [Turicibacter sp.]